MEFEGVFDLDATEAPVSGPLNLDDVNKPLLPEPVVKERAEKAHFGLKDASPGVETLTAAIQRGDEKFVRDQSAANVALKDRAKKQEIIDRLLVENPGDTSPELIDLIQGLSAEELKNPDTIWETEYGKEYINKVALGKKSDGSLFHAQLNNNPNDTIDVMDFASAHVARSEMARTKLQDLQTRWDDMSLFSKGVDFAGTMIPLRSWANISNSGEKFKDGVLDFLPGDTIANKVRALWSLEPQAFERTLSETLKTLEATSMTDALQFAQAVQSYSSSEEFLGNAFGVLDLFDVGTMASLGFRGAKLAKGAASTVPEVQVRKALKDAVKAASEVPTRPEKVTEVVGEAEKAAAIKAIQSVSAEQSSKEIQNVAEKLRGLDNVAPSIINPTKFLSDLGSLTTEAAARLKAKLLWSAERLTNSLVDPVMGERLTQPALARAAENAKEELLLEYFHLNDSIMNVVRNVRDRITTSDSVSLRLGDTQALPFDRLEKAEMVARDLYGLPEGTWRVQQEGPNFFIDIPRPINERTRDVQALLLTPDNRNPDQGNAFTKMWLNRIRSPAETTSEQGRANRNVAALGQAQFNRFIETAAEDFSRIPREYRDQFETVLRINRDGPSRTNPDERGRFYESVGELEEVYLQQFNRMPTEAEVHSYFQYVQLNDLDLIIRNALILNGKERMGVRKFSFETQANTYAEFEAPKVQTASFEGVPAKEIPWGTDHLTVAFYDPGANSFTYARRGANVEVRNLINDAVRESKYEIVRIADPLKRPLKEATGSNDVIEYVVTKKFNSGPLDLQQINNRPGGHVQYKHEWWLKQPKLYRTEGGVNYYEGDVTAFNFITEAQARKVAPHLEEARKLLDNKTALDDYAARHLPWDGAEVRKLFSDEGPFSPDRPFFVARSGQKWSDLNQLPPNTRNLSGGDYSLTSDIESAYTQHRDWNAMSLKNVGSEENPVYRLHQAELLDPTPTLARAVGQISRSRFFNDMKLNAAETFVKQYADVLDVDPRELSKYPSYYLSKPVWKDNADPVRLAEAKTMQNNAMTFIGEQSPMGKQLDWMKAKLVNGVENVAGDRAASWLSTTKMMSGNDPTSFFRSFAFHTKLGLFSIPQLFVQAQGLLNVSLISPRYAPSAMAGYTLQRSLMWNNTPEVLEAAAKKAAKLGWSKEGFKESWLAMERSGWNNVGRESAFWDDISDPSLYRSSTGDILNAGTIFFNEGERMVRMSAWNVAYLEWRKANTTVALDDRAIGVILNRADTLSGNMTRASKASWEQGVWSIPAQFSSYTARLLDQFWGRQLSAGEKARLFGGLSLLYGAPIAGGAATGIPFYEMWKQSAIEQGITDSDKFATTFYEGGLSMVLSAITGQDYNLAQRYGPGGFQIIRDLMTQDKNFIEAIIGPSGTTISDAVVSVVPIFGDFREIFKQGGRYEPAIADIIDATRTISSVNATLKTMTALQTGKYITKNEVYMSDMNSWDAVFSQITGLTPREVTDSMLMSQSLKDLTSLQRESERQFTKYIRRGLNEAANGNREAAESYYTRARSFLITGGFQPNQWSDLLQKAIGNQGSVIERIGTQWWKKAPPEEQQKRMKQVQDMLSDRKERNTP